MNSLLIKNASWIVTCNDKDEVLENVSLYAEDGVIKEIGKCLEIEAKEAIDAKDFIIYPGLINTHHHLYQTFSRNIPKVQKMELFPWLKTLYEIWKNLEEDNIYYSTITGAGDLLKNGCTTCVDHHYVFPKGKSEKFIDTQFEAAKDLGIRFLATRGSMDLSVKDGGLPPDSVVQDIDDIMKDSMRVVERFHDSSFGSMRQVALAPCSPFSVSEELLKQTAILARDLKVRMHTHLAETKDEEKYLLESRGIRPLEYMESLGWIGDDVWYAHGIHFTDEEVKRLGKTKTGVAHCPISNMKLSSGIAKVPLMLEVDAPVGLAVDGSASNDGSNLLEELRVGYLLHRLNNSVTSPTGAQLLKIATKGSASIIGRNDIGTIEIGKMADLFMVNKNRLDFVGATVDVAAIPATIGIKGCVDYTIVNGNIVVKDGKLVNIDEEKIQREAERSVKEYLEKSDI